MTEHSNENITIYSCFEACFLQKLNKNYDEREVHAEYEIHKSSLNQNINRLQEMLKKYDFTENFEGRIKILSLLITLYLELKSNGPWQCEEMAKGLNNTFKLKYYVEIDHLFDESKNFPARAIFDNCIEMLHLKLTSKEFKKYPSLIEVYCLIIYRLQEYKFDDICPVKVLPVALILIDDYVPCNKQKGLKCCKVVLHCLTWNNLKNGNYYEVIFQSFKKFLAEKDLEVTSLVVDCMKVLLNMLDTEIKTTKMAELFLLDLNEIYVESNLYRKCKLFELLENLIVNHQINCVRNKKKFDRIILDNLDTCVHREIRDVILKNILQCLKMWIKYCWPLWKYETDKKFISILFKILYTTNTEEAINEKLQNMLILLILLCDHEDILKLMENIKTSLQEIKTQSFCTKVTYIQNFIEKKNCQLHQDVINQTLVPETHLSDNCI